MRDKRRELEEKVGKLQEDILCIGGDFNARIGKEGKRHEEREMWRNSKEVNRDGRELLSLIEDRGWRNGMRERG